MRFGHRLYSARRWLSAFVVLGVVGGLGWAAWRAEGFVTPEPDLHDAGVWVTRADERRVGRTNTEIMTVDTSVSTASGSFELLQADASVFVRQQDPSMLVGLDPVLAASVPGPELPRDAVVELGGGTAAVHDPNTGVLVVTSTSLLLGVDLFDESQVTARFDGPIELAVGADGAVHVLQLEDGRLWTRPAGTEDQLPGPPVDVDPDAPPSDDDEERSPTSTSGSSDPQDEGAEVPASWLAERLDWPEQGLDRVEVAAVGSRPVVLDPDGGRLWATDPELAQPAHERDEDGAQDTEAPVEAFDVAGAGALPVLQRPGPAGTAALLATDTRWWSVTLADGTVTEHLDGGAGTPAAPVVVAGCAYGAWSGNGLIARVCDGGEVTTQEDERFATGAPLTWRVNRDRVVLNELETGRQLVFGDGEPQYLDEWAEAFTDEPEETTDTDEEEPAESTPQTRDRTVNEPPVANDVRVGTRPDRPVVVHPLRNDVDPDGDVLIISPLEPLDPAVGSATVIADGTAVLVELDPARTQPVSFPYEITDGHGHADTATITVEVVPDDRNTAPEPAVGDETTVVTGGTVVHDVVVGAFDPEADPISLLSATTEAGDLRTEANGTITFTATNEPGPVDVIYTLTDDLGAEAAGLLRVNVVPREVNEPPVARNDYAQTIVGREVVVDVLANDTDANGDPLSLVRVDNLSAGTVRWDPASPEVRFTADSPGAYNMVYRITDGRETAEAVLRVDVIEPEEGQGPTAVRDDVLLRAGSPEIVDVLANDVDPDGDVLIITGVTLPDGAPIEVEILQRALLRISTDQPLNELVEFDYHITDGIHEATGRVVVAPAPIRERSQPPIVGPDEYTVRAGGIAVLPVLDNDYDPDGGPVELVPPEPVDDATAARDGRLFMSDGELRYEAPPNPRGTVSLSTTIVDSAENTASGQLLINVIDADGERNNPPVAPTLEARVVAGGRVVIPVPLATMDPEGDIVTLRGLDSPPSRGAVLEVGSNEFVYEADEQARGTDEFTYRVVDQFGLEATGTVLVGIAGPGTSNALPVAVDDEVDVVPGTVVTVPALANDYDPDGDPISYVDEDDVLPRPGRGEAWFEDGELRYEAPADAAVGGSTSFAYTITDGRGGRDTGTVTVRFVEELPNRPPEPVDVIVEPQEPGATVRTAPLQDNDVDPDGDELTVVSVSDPDVVLHDDGSVSFEMPDEALQFTYIVTDGIDEARGAVVVPLAGRAPPVPLLDTAEVAMGEQVTIDVLANDLSPDGRDLVLLDVLAVRNGTAEVVDDQVVFSASQEQYVGSAGFAYLVGDADDPAEALTAIGTAQVRITGELNTPPTFTRLSLEVPQDGQRSLDLTGAVVDPDVDDVHTFRDLAGAGGGIDAAIDGTTLTVSAGRDTSPGTATTLSLTVDDGIDEAEGEIDVVVISSDRPLPVAVPDQGRTVQGEPIEIPVLDNDVNPFPDTPLTVIGVTQPPGATIATDGTTVTFEPDPERRDLGEVTFEYTIEDATGDPTRHVTGSVAVTVVGRPDIPAAPTCIGGESRSVQIGWAAPSANGARIEEYLVRINEYPTSGGSPRTEVRSFPGGSTVQRLDALTNGLEHTFEVAAINEAVIDEPEFSAPSPRCIPDQVPDQPDAPTVDFGDGELYLAFEAPPVDGSPVSALTLRNTTTGESVVLGPTVTEHTWSELENGTSYRFTLMATNDRGDSDISELSTGDGIPAGVPLNPVAPTIEEGDRLMTVRWSRPEENGDAVVEYRITIIRAGVETGTVSIPDGARRSVQLDTDNGVEYQFRMEARNKAGWSERSSASAPAVSAGRPFPVSSVSATEGDRATQLSFDEPDDNGAAITRYQVSINGGGWQDLASNRRVGGLSNGTEYRFRVRAVNAEGAGDASPNSNRIRPYGSPTTPPNLTSSDNGDRRITWSWGNANGNGRSIARYEVSLNNGSWSSVGTSRSFQHTVSSRGDSAQLRVRAISTAEDSARRTSGIAGPRSHTTPPPPPPPPPPTITRTVDDAFLLGTCARSGTSLSTWQGQSACVNAGGTWIPNGNSRTIDCQRRGTDYTVTYVGGRTETWNLWFRLTTSNNRWVKAAAMSQDTNASVSSINTC
ncbi:MAG: cadherin-like domain-containing protein [Nitriliruptoraceae bacterium]|nr:cadherin-like domain-containing protein [Nitriliruptoraceae bacterium]